MVWLFISVVLIVVVYLAVQFPAFRKAILVCLALLFIAVAAGAGWLYYGKIEDDKREELSRRLIRPDEIGFTHTVLGQTYGSWKVKGNVTNHSSHELSGFTLKIIVQDCPSSLSPTSRPQTGWDAFPLVEPFEQTKEPTVSGRHCTTIGENDASAYVSVPPNQMRAFELYVRLRDMPKPTKWEWTYSVEEARGKVK
jgi:hypothetical protein